jgi:fructokinase
VGVGIPGAESRLTGLIKNANSTCLIGKPLKRDLQAGIAARSAPRHDANCFALSEAVDGAGAGAAVVFGVILGTGVGGGIVVNGKPLGGANAIAGEWGHNPMPGEHLALACYCGRQDCIELLPLRPGAGVPTIAVSPAPTLRPPKYHGAPVAGDPACEATLQSLRSFAWRARWRRSSTSSIRTPSCSAAACRTSTGCTPTCRACGTFAGVFSDHVATRLLKHRHGDSSGVRGAAWLWN